MRKLISFSTVLLCIMIFSSCKKEESLDNSKQELITKINRWFDKQKESMFPDKAANVDMLKENLEYSNLKIEQSEQNEKIIIIPISESFKAQKIADKNSISNLILLMNASGDIRKGNVVLFKPKINGAYSKVPDNTFYNIFNTAKVTCDGQFQFLSVAGRRQYELQYDNGTLSRIGLLKAKEKNNVSRITTMCTDWYLEITIYYTDGTTEVTEEYLGTTCSEDCGQPNPWPTECPDGSSPGGGGINDVEYEYESLCMMTPQEAEDALASITSITLSDGGSSTGAEAQPDANGKITRPVVINRHSIRYTFPGGATAKYTLFFNGVLFKTTTNSAWKWDELNYSHIAMTEGGPPPCLSANVSAAVGVSISGDKTKANFTATTTANLIVSCLFGYVLNTKTDNINGEYPANEF